MNNLEATDDIEADLRAAFAADQPEETTRETVEAPASDGPVRDEHGRFAPKVDNAENTPQSATQGVPEPERAILPPASWSATAKAKFNALDPDVQAEVLRREKEMNDGLAQFQPKSERLNKLDAVLTPIKDRLTIAGISEDAYITALVRADEMLRGPNAAQALQMLAQQYGIPPGYIQAPQQGYQQQPQMDPVVQSLQQQLQQVMQRVESREEAEAAAQQQALTSEIEAFAADPAHMYFSNVSADMSLLLRSGKAQNLQEAYDKACRMDDTISALLAAPGRPPPGKPNGKTIAGSPGAVVKTTSADPTSSIEDDVRAAMQQLSGRV